MLTSRMRALEAMNQSFQDHVVKKKKKKMRRATIARRDPEMSHTEHSLSRRRPVGAGYVRLYLYNSCYVSYSYGNGFLVRTARSMETGMIRGMIRGKKQKR